jgi:uncharacterized protein involved in exopolysaccharide biosynthesis
MAERILELIFRRKFLLMLPIILGFSAGLFALSLSGDGYYSSRATIWVERPTDLTGAAFTEFNPYIGPAQNQANGMRELLATNQFVGQILRRVGPVNAPLVDFNISEIRKNTFIYPYGNHVLYIEYRAPIPQLAQLTVQAIVDEYADLYTSQVKDRALRAKTFYEEQLASARATLETATSELRAYTARNPQLNTLLDGPTLPPNALRDLEFARLVNAESNAREHYNTLLDKFADSQLSATTADGTSTNFIILDPPEVPQAPIAPGKRALVLPLMLGLAAGGFISSLAFIVYWRLDRRIHLPEDLSFLGGSVPVMSLPSLKAKGRRWPNRFVRIAAALQNGLRERTAAVASE